jgi:hypothetical protein
VSDSLLKEILNEIKDLNKRLDRLEWLLLDSKLKFVDPTPEEIEIIEEYQKDKKLGTISFKKFV